MAGNGERTEARVMAHERPQAVDDGDLHISAGDLTTGWSSGQFTRPAVWRNRTSGHVRNRRLPILDAAWAIGVRAFDTAEAYGESASRLKKWIDARRNADSIEVVTKCGSIRSGRQCRR